MIRRSRFVGGKNGRHRRSAFAVAGSRLPTRIYSIDSKENELASVQTTEFGAPSQAQGRVTPDARAAIGERKVGTVVERHKSGGTIQQDGATRLVTFSKRFIREDLFHDLDVGARVIYRENAFGAVAEAALHNAK
jgi:hypothetical protein